MKNLLTLLLIFATAILIAQENKISTQPVPEKLQSPQNIQVSTEIEKPEKESKKPKEKKIEKPKMLSFPTAPKKVIRKEISSPSNCKVAPNPTIIVQPDGSQITIFGKGTMVNSWAETADGYSIHLNSSGYYEYANKVNGNLVSSGVRANDPINRNLSELAYLNGKPKSIKPNLDPLKTAVLNQVRNHIQSKTFPTTGTVKVLALLIDYPDLQNIYTKTNFDSLFNGGNYRNGDGSFKVFYQNASHGQLTINVDVSGWYRAANGYAYYGNNNGSSRAADLVREAVNAAETAGVNFAQYDNNNDNAVDGILAVHAGPGAEQGSQNQYIWSHRWVLNGGTMGAVTYDGVYINDYMINPETRTSGSNQNMVGIGVICHEFGHNLGLPDLYDTDNSNGGSEGIGNWGLMGGAAWLGGEHRPGNFCAWSKIESNWDSPSILTIGQSGSYTLPPASTSQNQIFRINTNQNNEYYLLENRQKVGLDLELNGEGLAIWHINTTKTNGVGNGVNADENLKGVDLEEADGLNNLDNEINRGDNGDLFPGSSTNRTFDDNSNPNSKNYLNGNTGLQIRNITETGTNISFDFGPPVTGIAAGDTLYYQDFNSTTNSLPSGWTSSNSASPSSLWIWSNSAPGGQYSTTAGALNSTTSSNGFLSFPSDFYNTPFPSGGPIAMDASVTSNAISISSQASILIRFQEFLRFCCNNTNELVLEVSTNGSNWTAFDARGNGSSNVATANGELIEIDVSSVLANQTTAHIRFRQTGSSHYYWMVDDIAIVNGYDNALALEAWEVGFWPSFTRSPEFSMIPNSIFDPVGFTGQIKNSGTSIENGVGLRTEVFNNFSTTPVYNASVNLGGTSSPQQIDILNITNPLFSANYNADFTVRFTAFSNSINQRPDKATADYLFSLTDSVLAKDYGVFNSSIGPGSYVNGGFSGDKLGSLFSVGQTGGIATSMSIFIANNTANVGAAIKPQLYHWDEAAAAAGSAYSTILSLVSSNVATYTISNADLGTWITIPFGNQINLNGGNQYMLAFEQTNAVELSIGRDISNQDRITPVTNFINVSGSWGWIDAIPGMRLNFGNVSSTISDAKISRVANPSEYTKVPVNHHDLYTNSAWVRNVGTANLTNVRVKYSVTRNGSTLQTDSTPSLPTLVVGDSIQLFANNSTSYFLKGEYLVNYEVIFDGTDANPLDNTMNSDLLKITDSTFSRYDSTVTASLGITGGYGEIGLIYETQSHDTLSSVRAYFTNGGGQITGRPLSLNIRDFNGEPGNIIAASDTVIYTNTGGSFVDFTFTNNGGYVILPGDTFFIGVVNRDSNISLGTTANKFIDKTTWVQVGIGPWANNETYSFFVTYALEANFGNIQPVINPYPYYPISDINTEDMNGVADSLGAVCSTSGTVFSSDYDGNVGYSFFITDRSSGSQEGINVFNFNDVNAYNVNIGDSIMIFGSIIQFNGLTEFLPDSIVIINSGFHPNVSPNLINNLDESSESELVEMTNLKVVTGSSVSGSYSMQMTNGTNNFTIRIDSDTEIHDSLAINPLVAGDTICSIVGIGGQFDNSNPYTSGYQILPFSYNQLDRTSCACFPPVADFAFPLNNKCAGDMVTMGSSSTGTNPNTTYSWDINNDGSIEYTSTSITHQFNNAGNISVALIVGEGNCLDTVVKVILINALPVADAGVDQVICTGEVVAIGGSPTGTVGSSYFWNNAGTLSSPAVANPIASPTVTTIYTVTVTNLNTGCTSTDDVTVTVNQLPQADAGIDRSLCSGFSIQIGSSPASGLTYLWDNGASLNSSLIANPTASPSITTTYSVTVTDASTGCTATDQVVVTINQQPNLDEGPDKTICAGTSVQIGGSPTSTSPGATFFWQGGPIVGSNTIANPVVAPNQTTTYSVVVTSTAGCTNTNIVLVTVDPALNNTVTQNGPLLSANQSGATYQWLTCISGGYAIINGETNQGFTAIANGDYAVAVTLGSCSDTSACASVIGVGVDENIFEASIAVFPNPNNGTFKLDLGKEYIDNIQLSVRDIQGREVYSTIIRNQTTEISLDLSSGLYFVQVEVANKNTIKKLVIK